ncbi:uncharacterized protein BJ212DRAFT_1302401 [Suillus subaureus]|uniref:Uncharacterized protein n=1 Tax=Suillus subaureus TaxID=48587 RepID=A0A9P7E469_9AGAM|nr:uncharacterized protein BJ212DRAFT_1302401 [Suillus subaureus]KAG1810689.1 hypothetical protein BJ212DRAFT_1302401 [Suillus subaureus]
MALRTTKKPGEAEHSKLKAEQWRSAIEFNLPVTLTKLWGTNCMKPGDENGKQRQKLAHSTMLLVMAIQWGTSHMFPFERIIGALQKTNMNYKIAACIKAMLQEPGAPDVFNKAADILQQCCAPFTEEAFCMDIGILQTATEPDSMCLTC